MTRSLGAARRACILFDLLLDLAPGSHCRHSRLGIDIQGVARSPIAKYDIRQDVSELDAVPPRHRVALASQLVVCKSSVAEIEDSMSLLTICRPLTQCHSCVLSATWQMKPSRPLLRDSWQSHQQTSVAQRSLQTGGQENSTLETDRPLIVLVGWLGAHKKHVDK